MSLATSPPIRLDLSVRTNDDKLVALAWKALDKVTPIAVASAVMTMVLQRVPPLTAQTVTINSTTPGDLAGWIDTAAYSSGQVLVHLPHEMWVTYTGRYGIHDVVAVAATTATTRTLARGEIIIEEGV